MACPDCGRQHKRGKNNRCANCYQKRYRVGERRVKHRESVKRYTKRNPDKRRIWVNRWQTRTGRLVPTDIHALRYALKFLERAVEAAQDGTPIRLPSQRRRNQALERDARLGNSQSVFIAGKDSGADNHGRGSTFTLSVERA